MHHHHGKPHEDDEDKEFESIAVPPELSHEQIQEEERQEYERIFGKREYEPEEDKDLQQRNRRDKKQRMDAQKKLLQPYSQQEAKQHIAEGNMQWKRAGELLADLPEDCVDGRSPRLVIGTPGGNAGEFLVTMRALEKETKTEFSAADIEEIFHKYLDVNGRFYEHTDSHAIQHFHEAIEADPQFSFLHGKDNHKRREDLIFKGPASLGENPEGLEDAIFAHLTHPKCIGCGHLKYMLTEFEQYDMRPELVQDFFKAYFKALWRRDPRIEYYPIDGNHEERAVFVVRIPDQEITANTEFPIFQPQTNVGQAFVYHPQAAAYLRHEIAQHLPAITGLSIDVPSFEKQLNTLAEKQLQATLGHLAKGKPLYEAVIQRNGSYEVTGGAIAA